MTYGAFGLVEVLGEANAVLVLDRMLKTAEVFYETQDTKCGGHARDFYDLERLWQDGESVDLTGIVD